MQNKYTLQLKANSKMDIVAPGGIIDKQECSPDFGFLEKQLEFTYNVINGNAINSLLESEIIGKQIWKSIAENTLGFDDKYNLFKKLQAGLAQNITIAIAYAQKDMSFECSIPWELLAFTQGNQNVFLYQNDNVDLLRKYAGEKSINFNPNHTSPDDAIFEAPCKILLYVDGPENAEDAKDTVAENYELIQFKVLKDKLAKLANTINPHKVADPYQETDDNNLVQLKFIRSNFNNLVTTVNEWKPTIVHFITHGKYEEDGAKILISQSGLSYEWITVNAVEENMGKCTWHVPMYILEICHSGRSNLPLLLSALGAKIVIANMFKINQVLSQNFYSNFYSKIFDIANKETFIKAFHFARRSIFQENNQNENSLSYYGLPVLYYNLDTETDRRFFAGGNKNKPQKAGENAVEDEDSLLLSGYSNIIKDELNKPFDNEKMAGVIIRKFLLYINTRELRQRFSTKDSRRRLLSKWINGNLPPEKTVYDYFQTKDFIKNKFEEIYDPEDFVDNEYNTSGQATASQQPGISGLQNEKSTDNTAGKPSSSPLGTRF